MRTVFIVMFIALSTSSFAQDVTLYVGGKEVKTKSNASTAKTIYTKAGTFNFNQLDSIKTSDATLMSRFKAAKQDSPTTQPIISPIVQQADTLQATQSDISYLVNGLDKFRMQRNVGKGMQLVGLAATGVAILMAQNPDENNEVNSDMIKVLGIGGASLGVLGLIIDIDASKHLNFKVK